MAENNQVPQSMLSRAAARVGHSAEYLIAAALVAVCVVVGGALWLLQPDSPRTETAAAELAPGKDAASRTFATEETAAADEMKRRLGADFKQIEQQRRRAEEEVRRERQRVEAEAAEALRKARIEAAAKTAAAQAVAVPSPPVRPATPLPAKPKPVVTDAAIDWNSCRRPSYPELSVRRKEQGAVAVQVDLDTGGNALRSRVSESSGHERLDAATQRAVEKCRFRAATLDGVAQASTAEVRFNWKLQD